jgi:exopolysaccharide production protein ExoZ
MNPNIPLASQWNLYTNPLNQVLLFLSGFLIGLLLKKRLLNYNLKIILFSIGLILFIYIPSNGKDTINIVTGIERIIFSICCIMICVSLYKTELKFNKIIHKPLIFLGDISYSIYLIHPIVYSVVKYINSDYLKNKTTTSSSIAVIIISIFLTLLVSFIVYEKYEKFFLKFGKSKPIEKHN